MPVRDVLIIGAGPSGLAAAIAAKKHGLDYQVLEQGALVNSIYHFPPSMVFFTTPELLEIGGLPLTTPHDKPTRAEALTYYRKVVDAYDLQIAFGEKVVSVDPDSSMRSPAPAAIPSERLESANAAVAKALASHAVAREEAGERRREVSAKPRGGGGAPPQLEEKLAAFDVTTRSMNGVQRVRQARNVVFAIGYYDHPATLGVPGEDLPHVSHYFGEPHRHYRQRVVIVGGGNSAAEAALLLYRSGAHVTMVHRHPTLKRTIKYWVRPDIENRIKEGSIAARFNARLLEIRPNAVVVEVSSSAASGDDEAARQRELFADADASHAPASPVVSPGTERAPAVEQIGADAVYLLTGYRTDTDLLCRAGVRLNDRDAPVHNAGTFETNVPGLFVAGGAIAGVDTGTVFIENGRFHGQKIVDEIARRLNA